MYICILGLFVMYIMIIFILVFFIYYFIDKFIYILNVIYIGFKKFYV